MWAEAQHLCTFILHHHLDVGAADRAPRRARARPHPQAEDDLELHVCQRRRSVLFQHQSLRSSCHQDEASLVQRIFLATSSPTRTVYNGLMISSEPSINQIIISKIDVQGTCVTLWHQSASISINQHQSESISINQWQCADVIIIDNLSIKKKTRLTEQKSD